MSYPNPFTGGGNLLRDEERRRRIYSMSSKGEKIGRFAKNYWDAGICVIGGGLCSYNGVDLDVFGNYDGIVGAAMVVLGSISPVFLKSRNEIEKQDRSARNLFGGLTTMLFGRGDSVGYSLGPLTAAGFFLMDPFRRKYKTLKTQELLETIV